MRERILLTGATGYVGGRLRRLLEQRGSELRCLTRATAGLASRVAATTEVVAGDVLDLETLGPALGGIETAYYLIHSMGADADFEERDRTAARNFATAARTAGVRRITWAGLPTAMTCRRTCAADTKWVRCCVNPAYQSSSCEPPSSLVPAACPSR
jgi:nucleoside-diphosphate-sugar epimerase